MIGIGHIAQSLNTLLTNSVNGLGFVPMKSDFGNAFDLAYIPVNQIKTDEKNFQNRADKYSEKSVQAIIKAVKNNSFNWFAFDPVLLWENPDGDLIVLSGHSRTEAFRRLASENPDLEIDGLNFSKIPSKIFKGDFLYAKNLALNSNALSTPETLLERADFYRKQRQQLSKRQDIAKLREKALRENQGAVIWDLSFLPPDGLTVDSLRRFKLQEDSEGAFENYIRAVNIAQWIGKAFQIYKGLSTLHDSELFKFLTNNYGTKSGQYNSFTKLNDRLQILYPRNVANFEKVDFDGNFTTPFGLVIYEKNDDEINEIQELETEAKRAKRELDNKIKDLRGRTSDKAQIFEIVTPYFNDYVNSLFQWWNSLDREKVRKTDKNQGALFGMLAQMIDDYSVNDNDVLCAGLGKPTVKFEFEDNADLFNFFAKKNDYSNAQNVDFENVATSTSSSGKRGASRTQSAITTPETLYLPYSEGSKALPGSANPKSLPPASQNIPQPSSPKALPPSGLENDETFIPFGYEKITDEKVIQRFNESRNILNNSGLIPVSDIISVIEKKPSVIFTTAGTDGIKKYKFKGKEDGEFIFEAVNDNGEPIPGEVNLRFFYNGIERLNALKSWFINPESTSKATSPTSKDWENAAILKSLLDPITQERIAPDWDAIYKRLVDSHHWNSFDPESAAEYDVKIFRNAYNNVIAELPENRKADFTQKFIAKVYEIARLNAAAPSAAVTGRGGITAKKAAKYNAANDRYMQARADFGDWLNNYAERAAKIEERERKAAMNAEERRDERFEVIKKDIDYFSALLKNRAQVPYYSISNARQNLQSKLETEAYKGNVETITKLLDYMRPLNVFTNRSSVWQLADLAQRRRAKYQKAEKEFEAQNSDDNADYKIEFDENEDRVKIYFNGIPSENISTWLKQHNFRWSPRNKAWQRQITVDSRYVVNKFNTLMKSGELSGLGKPTIKFEFEDNAEIFKTFGSGINGFSVTNQPASIFNCPTSQLNFKGFKPTYKRLNSYDDLIEPATGNKTLVGYGFEKATLDELNNACKYYYQVEKLAEYLKGDNYLQSAFNLWHWLHENIKYNFDKEGEEEIRVPARTWADRESGVDCDCLAVFTACVLYCMGYEPKFEIVGFDENSDVYSHIFVNLYGAAVDRVLPVFLMRPSYIKKTLIMEIPVFELNGGADLSANATLNGIYKNTLKTVMSGDATADDSINLRKMQVLVSLQNADENAYRFGSLIMPYVSVIDDDGAFYFESPEVAEYVENADKELFNLKLQNANETELQQFFNNVVSTLKNVVVNVVKNDNQTSVTVLIRNPKNETVKTSGDWIKKELLTLNPNFVAMHESLKDLLSVNFYGLATRFAVGLMSEAEAKEIGYDSATWTEAVNALNKIVTLWTLTAGNKADLLEIIKNGSKKEPLYDVNLSAQFVDVEKNNATLSGCKRTLRGLAGLGETINVETALDRLGETLTKILEWCEKIEPYLTSAATTEKKAANNANAENNLLSEAAEMPVNFAATQQNNDDDNNNMLFYSVLGSLLAVSAVSIFSSTKKRKRR